VTVKLSPELTTKSSFSDFSPLFWYAKNTKTGRVNNIPEHLLIFSQPIISVNVPHILDVVLEHGKPFKNSVLSDIHGLSR
jgi:hypothetical protein